MVRHVRPGLGKVPSVAASCTSVKRPDQPLGTSLVVKPLSATLPARPVHVHGNHSGGKWGHESAKCRRPGLSLILKGASLDLFLDCYDYEVPLLLP